MGEKCKIDEANIRKYENGKIKPSLQTYRKIAAALGVYISDLVEDWGQFTREEMSADWGENLPISHSEAIKFGGYPVRNSEKPLLDNYRQLNQVGQSKAVEQVEMLTKIPDYRKDTNTGE